MELNININKVVEDVRVQMEKEAEELMRRRVRGQFNTLFDNGQWHGHSKGVGYLIIEDTLDQLITNDNFKKRAAELTRELFPAMLEEQVKYQLKRRAMKLAASEVHKVAPLK